MKQYEIPSLALKLIGKLNSMRQNFSALGYIDNADGNINYTSEDFELDLNEQLENWMDIVDSAANANFQLQLEIQNTKEINSILCDKIEKQKKALKSKSIAVKNLKIKLEKAKLFPAKA